MNINGYGLNVQYQKTELSYEMSLSKVEPSESIEEITEQSSRFKKIYESHIERLCGFL